MLPASEDTRTDQKYHEKKSSSQDVITVTASADFAKGDIVIWGPLVGIAKHAALTGAKLTIRVKEGITVDTAELAAGATFATPGQEVWYNATTEEVTDLESAGLYGIGWLDDAGVKNSDGVIVFQKRKLYVDGADT